MKRWGGSCPGCWIRAAPGEPRFRWPPRQRGPHSSTYSSLFLLYFFLEPGLDRKLEFLLEPVSLTKVLGATALLPCVVSGYPPPHVRWMLGDKLVEERYEPFQLLGRDCPSRVQPAGPTSSSHTAAAARDGATLALRLQGCQLMGAHR